MAGGAAKEKTASYFLLSSPNKLSKTEVTQLLAWHASQNTRMAQKCQLHTLPTEKYKEASLEGSWNLQVMLNKTPFIGDTC